MPFLTFRSKGISKLKRQEERLLHHPINTFSPLWHVGSVARRQFQDNTAIEPTLRGVTVTV